MTFEVGLETKLKPEGCMGEIYGISAEKVSEGDCEIRGTSGQAGQSSLSLWLESPCSSDSKCSLTTPKATQSSQCHQLLYQKTPIIWTSNSFKKHGENVFKPAAIREIQIKTRIVPVKLSRSFKNYTIWYQRRIRKTKLSLCERQYGMMCQKPWK